jgi:hypothetical protein
MIINRYYIQSTTAPAVKPFYNWSILYVYQPDDYFLNGPAGYRTNSEDF